MSAHTNRLGSDGAKQPDLNTLPASSLLPTMAQQKVGSARPSQGSGGLLRPADAAHGALPLPANPSWAPPVCGWKDQFAVTVGNAEAGLAGGKNEHFDQIQR